MLVREATPDDIGSMTFRHDLDNVTCGPSTFERELQNERARAYVAEIGDRIVGNVVAIVAHRPDVRETPQRFVHLMLLYVAPDVRNAGVGTALMTAVEQLARDTDAECVTLHVREDNPHARRLYERRGYRVYADASDGFWMVLRFDEAKGQDKAA
jgi:ribosomal protein S18 acetylase RimI-like enzyme